MTINSQAKGKRAERDLVAYLKSAGWPDARRHVRTGDRFTADEGDIRLEGPRGVGTVVLEVKHHAGGLNVGQVVVFLSKLWSAQCRPGELGILVERRERVTDPGEWWAHMTWLTAFKLVGLVMSKQEVGTLDYVRTSVASAMELVRGYQQRQAKAAGIQVNPFLDGASL
ncbi:MAG TPA: hypothetical protein VJ757_01420 [Pseudonocardiaceae bacterium]|nr:hypothetical protein [Pseudonocardiaceae bacterium]